jgi:hypothetical protein
LAFSPNGYHYLSSDNSMKTYQAKQGRASFTGAWTECLKWAGDLVTDEKPVMLSVIYAGGGSRLMGRVIVRDGRAMFQRGF